MNNKLLKTMFAMALFGMMIVNSQAASIWLEPVEQSIKIGQVAYLEIWADASDEGGSWRAGWMCSLRNFPGTQLRSPL
jgi:hypothetical protein